VESDDDELSILLELADEEECDPYLKVNNPALDRKVRMERALGKLKERNLSLVKSGKIEVLDLTKRQ